MVREYLEKTRQRFVERKLELAKIENDYHMQLKENIEMIKLLEDSTDPNFESFSPRRKNNYNKEKVLELREQQKHLKESISEVNAEIKAITAEIEEVDEVIKSEQSNSSRYNVSPTMKRDPKYKRAILSTQEKERQRIARDLHDTTVQCLTSLIHKSELCMKLIDIDPIRCKLELSSTSKVLREVIDDTRKMIYDLRPMSFDDIGFNITVERFLDKLKSMSTVNYNLHISGEEMDIDSTIEITLLRVIQEACSNSVKHGKAENVDVIIQYRPDMIEVIITDDGIGFDVDSSPETVRENNSGFGLSMMKERVYLLSGEIAIISSEGNGCCTKVSIPIYKEDN